MAYDDGLAQRVREALASEAGVIEKRMFGGLAFMVRGNMCCGVSGKDLMARVGPDAYEEALGRPFARPMDFTGRPLRGFVYVGSEGCATDEELSGWVNRCLEFVGSLPAK